VVSAVELDYQLERPVREVANEWSDRDLAIEASAFELSVADMLPEHAFGSCRVVA
jgi:hypothetical protein